MASCCSILGRKCPLQRWLLNNPAIILGLFSYAPLLPDNTEELYSVGLRSVQAIEAASAIGSEYTVNNSAIGLYVAAGVTTDWVKAEAGVNLSYIFELPNGGTKVAVFRNRPKVSLFLVFSDAPWWFMLPARQIRPVVEETWAGIRALYEHVEETFVVTTTTLPSSSPTESTTTSPTPGAPDNRLDLDPIEDSFASDVFRIFPV